MAGSLNHVVDPDGSFRMDLIENMGDAHEALEECFDIIGALVGDDKARLDAVCDLLNYPRTEAVPVVGRRRG